MADEQLSSVLQALDVLHSVSTDTAQKRTANQFLEEFQKSTEAWKVCHQVLAGEYPDQAKIFSAQTLKSKISYDLYQIDNDARMELKQSIVDLLDMQSRANKMVVGRHLSIALANFALQYTGWHDVVPEMVAKFGSSGGGGSSQLACLLEFLKVLPEEMADSNKSSLSDDEFKTRAREIIEDNAKNVVQLLVQYSQGADTSGANQTLIFECLNSWLKEVSIVEVGQSGIFKLIFDGLANENTFEPAVECVCSAIHETRDVMDTIDTINILYPQVIELRPRISQCKDDPEAFRGYTKIFAEAGESWHTLVAKKPKEFRPLVESIAECTAFDEDLDVVQYTFYFWYSLKQMLTLSNFANAREHLSDIYVKLIDVVIHHLKYPQGNSDDDLFGGDKEEEEKFRSFRHEMGDVLKDCCAVVGSGLALQKAYDKVRAALNTGSSWQEIEAPLFSMRAMAREVTMSEDNVLPQVMRLLVQLPEHEKIRYAATLVLGRYTEWTAMHPDMLDFQLQYITNGFDSESRHVMSAAAQALMHFCQDCSGQLTGYLEQLHPFYEKLAKEVDVESLYEVTDGIGHVIDALPIERVQPALEHFAQPIVQRLLEKTRQPGEDKVYRELADEIELLTIFVSIVRPREETKNSPISLFVINLYPNLVLPILHAHGQSTFVAERCCKFIKTALHTCGVGLQPILPQIAETLVSQFEATHYGCYLWVSGALVREFGDELKEDGVTPDILEAVWQFAHRQAQAFFRQLSAAANPQDLPDLVEDFFRLMGDVLMYIPYKLISSDLFEPAFQAATSSLALEQIEPVTATLHFLLDLIGFGMATPPVSFMNSGVGSSDGDGDGNKVPGDIQRRVQELASSQGHFLCAKIISGLIYTLPRDCVTDASAVVLKLIQLVPATQALEWIGQTVDMLPEGSVSHSEKANLLSKIDTAMGSGDLKRVRTLLRDFTALYARRNVTPRSRHVNSIAGIGGQFSYTM